MPSLGLSLAISTPRSATMAPVEAIEYLFEDGENYLFEDGEQFLFS